MAGRIYSRIVYKQLYYDAHFKRAERTAALADYKVRKYCYTAAIASTCDLLESTRLEAAAAEAARVAAEEAARIAAE